MNRTERMKAQREHVEAATADVDAPALYRADLFRRVKAIRIGDNVSQLGVRQIAAETRLSTKSVIDALAGNALKLDTLYKLSRYFGVPWSALFDTDFRFGYSVKDDGTGIEIGPLLHPTAADIARV